MQTQEIFPPTLAFVTDVWKSDLARFRSEVEEAQSTGHCDGLTLAEMECSLDLMNADLAALLLSNKRDDRTEKSIITVTALMHELERLIEEMRPLCQN